MKLKINWERVGNRCESVIFWFLVYLAILTGILLTFTTVAIVLQAWEMIFNHG